jgi:hypothetical protein
MVNYARIVAMSLSGRDFQLTVPSAGGSEPVFASRRFEHGAAAKGLARFGSSARIASMHAITVLQAFETRCHTY